MKHGANFNRTLLILYLIIMKTLNALFNVISFALYGGKHLGVNY